MSAPFVLVNPLVSAVLSPLIVNPLMVTLDAAIWKISPEAIAAVAGTTMASGTLVPVHGSTAAFGPRIVSDLLTITFSAYIPADTCNVCPFWVSVLSMADWIVR